MYAMDAVKQAANRAGLTLYRVSLDMGKTRQYVNNIITRGSVPQADTLARMLDICGYSLCAIPKDKVPEDALIISYK